MYNIYVQCTFKGEAFAGHVRALWPLDEEKRESLERIGRSCIYIYLHSDVLVWFNSNRFRGIQQSDVYATFGRRNVCLYRLKWLVGLLVARSLWESTGFLPLLSVLSSSRRLRSGKGSKNATATLD